MMEVKRICAPAKLTSAKAMIQRRTPLFPFSACASWMRIAQKMIIVGKAREKQSV